ncbi:helix-turn-helix domain-containing protein [Pseudomonas segetis]
MTKHSTDFLDKLLANVEAPSMLKAEHMSALATQIESAISAPTQLKLQFMSSRLIILFNKLLKTVPAETLSAIRNSQNLDPLSRTAYMMGQLSFAQVLVSKTLSARPEDGFFETMYDKSYIKYIAGLVSGPLSNTELSEISGERVETVSRKIKKLRQLGICDFRREGVSVLNFLTPPAKFSIDHTRLPKEAASEPEPKSLDLSSLMNGVPEYMKHPQTFAIKVATA